MGGLKMAAKQIPADETVSDADREKRILSRLGYERLSDILFYLPRGYRDYSRPRDRFAIDAEGGNHLYKAHVASVTYYRSDGGKTPEFAGALGRLRIDLVDATGATAGLWAFGASGFAWKAVQPGEELHLYGRITQRDAYSNFTCVARVPANQLGRILPIYPAKPGVAGHDLIAPIVARALADYQRAGVRLYDALGMTREEIAGRLGYRSVEAILYGIHHPPSLELGQSMLQCARDLAALNVVRQAELAALKTPVRGAALAVTPSDLEGPCAYLKFPLTDDQRRGAHEILADLAAPYPMNRLLSGDVGTGKTLTYLLPCIAAASQGYPVAVMTPNALLVGQIAQQIAELAPDLPVACVTGSLKKKDRHQLESARLHIGTTALLNTGYAYQVVVVDEEHKFGREQRDRLRENGTNVLTATATPIPRTAGLISHGGMDVSYVRQCPVEKHITTRLVGPDSKRDMLHSILATIRNGGQAAIVFAALDPTDKSVKQSAQPTATQNDDVDGTSAKATETPSAPPLLYLNRLAAYFEQLVPGKVGVLTGPMSEDEKTLVLERMKAREIDLLLATTVIEVGVTLPDLREITIMNAERFGVSQLQQLRGRVARTGGEGRCNLFVPGELNDDAASRLNMLVTCNDGFALAEMDMRQRGFGDLDSNADSQAGRTKTLFANMALMPDDIERLMDEVPGMKGPRP